MLPKIISKIFQFFFRNQFMITKTFKYLFLFFFFFSIRPMSMFSLNLASLYSILKLFRGFLKIFTSQKQPSRGVLKKRCSENMQSNFIEIAHRHVCSPVNLLHNFRTPFPKITSEGLLLTSRYSHLRTLYGNVFITS